MEVVVAKSAPGLGCSGFSGSQTSTKPALHLFMPALFMHITLKGSVMKAKWIFLRH